ncbi:protein of unknown function DUF58 [Thermobaculum terrenum ATCC BAA-798]|uniref:DUF58 domain-containing protein n=1 Tax=Thermobaculum terrenum (strain ATCC BAA-798 / CCMEE 7001 / YNP1) TaxID=525904 RepID=D1CB28_THET1|nr:DUF58 domain-containing protein [Thermobaculum terrenum]ACZ41993.1 protein of unknown function DUF58 [Thermobaculum terrenum ATCC BAA-798]
MSRISPAVLGLLLITVGLAAVSTGWRLLFVLFWLILGVTAVAWLWVVLAFRGLKVVRPEPTLRVQVGDVLRERVSFINTSRIPKLWLEVHDGGDLPGRDTGSVITVPSKTERRWWRRTVCERRGVYRLGPLTVTASDPFGIFSRTIQIGRSHELVIYPQIVTISDFRVPALELPGGSITQKRTFQANPYASSVRDYNPGDSLSHVSWKATARHQRLMVKEFEFDPVSDIWLVLDLNRRWHVPTASHECHVRDDPSRRYLNSTVEYAVTTASSLASYLLERGRSVGLITWSKDRYVVLPDRGIKQLWKILDVLALVDVSSGPSLKDVLIHSQPLFAGNYSIVVITPDISREWVAGLALGRGRYVQFAEVIIESRSFDKRAPRPAYSLNTSAAKSVTYVLRNGDDISYMLGEPSLSYSRSGDARRRAI